MMTREEYIKKNCPQRVNSSSEILDKELLKRGVISDFKFAHDYKLPDEQSYETYEKFLCGLYYDFEHENKDEIFLVLESEIKKITSLNLELANIKLKKHYKIFNLLLGVCYKFAPDDIKWFIEVFSDYNMDTKHNHLKEDVIITKTYGISPSYVLCPKHKKKLIELLETAHN